MTRSESKSETTHASHVPSAWVERFGPEVTAGGRVLDLACGAGRHLRWFLGRGHPVVGIDRDLGRVADLADHPKVELREIDLEVDGPEPDLGRGVFAGVVVTNYLHRPLFPAILAAVEPGGILIYETFAVGNELLGRPRNPDFLLTPEELRERVSGEFEVLAYAHGRREDPGPAIVQQVAARRRSG